MSRSIVPDATPRNWPYPARHDGSGVAVERDHGVPSDQCTQAGSEATRQEHGIITKLTKQVDDLHVLAKQLAQRMVIVESTLLGVGSPSKLPPGADAKPISGLPGLSMDMQAVTATLSEVLRVAHHILDNL